VYFHIGLFFTTSFNLGTKIRGAETCYLGVMVHDVELGVFFLICLKEMYLGTSLKKG
jgi:hypothetical protein